METVYRFPASSDDAPAAMDPADADLARRLEHALSRRGYPIPETVLVDVALEVQGVERY